MKTLFFTNNRIHKLRGIFIWAALALAFLIIAYIFMPDEPALTGPTNEELAWMDKPTGSAMYLDGHTLLVSIYMDNDGSSSDGWSDEDISKTQGYLDMANDYLVTAGKEYGCDVNLTYDIYEHPDLMYFTEIDVLDEEDNKNNRDHDITDSWIEENVDYLSLLDKYDADSIGFLYFMNAGGRSWCYPYYPDPEYPEYGYLEKAYLYLYDEYGEEYENPATYTHEILHMFGAVDLYVTSKEDNITGKIIKYVDKTYPRDIMYTVYDEEEEHVYTHIPCQIGPITAYFIGFTDYCEELEVFPDLKRSDKASFPEYEY